MMESYYFNCSIILQDVAPNRFISKVRPSIILEISVEQYNCRVVADDFTKAKRCVTDSRTLINLEKRAATMRDVILNAVVAENVCFSTNFFLKTRVLVRLHIVYMTVYTHLGLYIPIVIHLMSYTSITCSNCHL